MSTDSTYEAVFAHAGPWTEDDYLTLPDMPARVELVDGALLRDPAVVARAPAADLPR